MAVARLPGAASEPAVEMKDGVAGIASAPAAEAVSEAMTRWANMLECIDARPWSTIMEELEGPIMEELGVSFGQAGLRFLRSRLDLSFQRALVTNRRTLSPGSVLPAVRPSRNHRHALAWKCPSSGASGMNLFLMSEQVIFSGCFFLMKLGRLPTLGIVCSAKS